MKKINLLLLLLPWFLASQTTQTQVDTLPIIRDTNYLEMTITHYINTKEPVTESWDRFHYREWKKKKLVTRIEKLNLKKN